MMIATLFHVAESAFSDVLEGVALEKLFLRQAHRPPSFWQISEFIYAMNYTCDKHNLASNEIFILGKDDGLLLLQWYSFSYHKMDVISAGKCPVLQDKTSDPLPMKV